MYHVSVDQPVCGIHANTPQRLRQAVSNGDPIADAGIGIGSSATFTERGGVVLPIFYNAGRYRMNGRGSLAGLFPSGDATQVVVEMGHEVGPVVENTPVLLGVNGTDPFRQMNGFIADFKRGGFSRVQNFPTVGLIDADGVFRQNLEETGMRDDTEVAMIREAADRWC